MPNTTDATNTLYLVARSGLVVSGLGNAVTVTTSIADVSGHALTSQRASGTVTLIALKQGNTVTRPQVGGVFTEIEDYVDVEIYVRAPILNSGVDSRAALRTRVDDFKITVASGSFTNPARPYLIGEEAPQHHLNASKQRLRYRFRNLL